MKFDPKIDLYLEAATGASETPSHRGKSRFPLAGVSLGAQYRPPLGQSLQCWRPNPGFDIVKQANLHYQPKYSTCRSSSAGCPPEPRLALACRPEDSVLYISRKALISAWFEVLEPLRIFLTDLLGATCCPKRILPVPCVSRKQQDPPARRAARHAVYPQHRPPPSDRPRPPSSQQRL